MGADWTHAAPGVLCVSSASALLLFSLYSHETTSCCSNWPRRRRLLACLLGYYHHRGTGTGTGGGGGGLCLCLTLALLAVSLLLAPASGALVYTLHAVMGAVAVGVYGARTMAGCVCSRCRRRRERRVWPVVRRWCSRRLGGRGLERERPRRP